MEFKDLVRYLYWGFMILAVFGASSVIELAKFENADLVPSLILMGIGSAGLIIIWVYRRRTTLKVVVKEERKIEKAWIKREQSLESDIGFLVFPTGMIAEFISFNELYQRLSAVTIYFLLSYMFYIKYRRKIQTTSWAFFFHMGLVLTILIISFTWRFPESLSEIGMVDIYDSRKISYLTFLYLQISLIISTTISASLSWRTNILIKKKLSAKDLMLAQRDFLIAIDDGDLKENLREIVSDVATLRETIIAGQFRTTMGWGWSIVDRILNKLSKRKRTKEKAEELGLYDQRFEKFYNVRNKTVHGGYKPNFEDALDFLILVKHILVRLSSSEQMKKLNSKTPSNKDIQNA